MEDNEDQPEDVRKATPVEEEIARGEIDETSGGNAAPVELARKRHRCDKDSSKRPKKSPKNEGDCCRERLAKAAGLPRTATFLVYEKECTLPRTKPIPRHCLTKEEWIDVLATPSRRCPPPCLQREVTRKIRPVSTRLSELARPPKNRLLNTLQDRAGTLPTELVDHLIQTLEGEACLTPEQAERMFRDKENRARRKYQKRGNKPKCTDEESKNREKRRGPSSTVSEFDREAVNSQYLMAESFVRSILDWKCPIPREEFKDIAEVILQRLARVLEYKPVNGEDRKSQQMRFLADVVASWISGVLFEVADARRAELEEECERRRRAREEESDEDTDDESDEEVGRGDDDDDDDGGDDEKKDLRRKKKERPPKKRKDDRGKKGRKDRKDDDDEDDDDKLGKSRKKDGGEREDRDGEGDGEPGSEDAEEKLKDDGDTEPAGGDAEKDSGEEFHDARGEPGSSPEETEVTVEAEEIGEGEKSGERDQEKIGEGEPGIVEETAAEAESAVGVADGDGQVEQAEDDAASKIREQGKPEEAKETEAETAVVEVTEAPPMTIDEPILIEPVEKTESTPTLIDEPVPIEPVEKTKGDQQTIDALETGKMAAGDVKDAKELPIESTDPAKVQEIPEGKEIPEDQAVGAGDQEKEIQKPEKLSASEVTEIEKDLKVTEEPAKIVKVQSEVMEKRDKPRRRPSRIPSVVTIVGRKKLRTDAPFLTFDRIFHTIYNAIESSRENPGVDAITNRLHRAVYEKCSSVVQDDRPEPLPDLTKDVLDVMSGKIALWLRDVLTESDLTFMSKFPATVESSSVREWSRWMDDVSDTANTWSTWIQRTIRQAEAMRSGRVTRGDWSDWTKSVDEDAHLWRRFYVQSLHQAHQNLTMIRDRRVVKTGERKLDFDSYEREMKITDLETER